MLEDLESGDNKLFQSPDSGIAHEINIMQRLTVESSWTSLPRLCRSIMELYIIFIFKIKL